MLHKKTSLFYHGFIFWSILYKISQIFGDSVLAVLHSIFIKEFLYFRFILFYNQLKPTNTFAQTLHLNLWSSEGTLDTKGQVFVQLF